MMVAYGAKVGIHSLTSGMPALQRMRAAGVTPRVV